MTRTLSPSVDIGGVEMIAASASPRVTLSRMPCDVLLEANDVVLAPPTRRSSSDSRARIADRNTVCPQDELHALPRQVHDVRQRRPRSSPARWTRRRLFEANTGWAARRALGARAPRATPYSPTERRRASAPSTDLRRELVRAAGDTTSAAWSISLATLLRRRSREDDEFALSSSAAPGERDHGREQGRGASPLDHSGSANSGLVSCFDRKSVQLRRSGRVSRTRRAAAPRGRGAAQPDPRSCRHPPRPARGLSGAGAVGRRGSGRGVGAALRTPPHRLVLARADCAGGSRGACGGVGGTTRRRRGGAGGHGVLGRVWKDRTGASLEA